MKLILPNKKVLSSSVSEKLSLNEDKEENNDKSSSSKLIMFLILIVFMILLILTITLVLIYKYFIKPDKQKSRRNKKPEIFLTYKERIKVDKYINDCMNGVLHSKEKYKKSANPDISVIIPVYNKENFILRILRSIQNQSFKNIEIIFCDDGSYDNSTKLIKEFQNDDERIVLMSHNTNKGTLMTRNDGAKIAKGEYLLFIDCDDLLVNNILEKSYLKAKAKNIDIIQFQTYSGDFFKSFYCSNKKRKTDPIYQPELSSLMYYENGFLHQSEFNIWGKLIKRDTFLEGIKSIDEYYLNQNMSLHEDGLILFILFKKAKSYLFINDYGLLYYENEFSTMKNLKNRDRINKETKDSFLYLEFMFNYTNNTLYEKNMAVFQFKSLINGFNDIFLNTTQGFDYIYKIIDLYLHCQIISREDKTFIRNIKSQFKKVEHNLTH